MHSIFTLCILRCMSFVSCRMLTLNNLYRLMWNMWLCFRKLLGLQTFSLEHMQHAFSSIPKPISNTPKFNISNITKTSIRGPRFICESNATKCQSGLKFHDFSSICFTSSSIMSAHDLAVYSTFVHVLQFWFKIKMQITNGILENLTPINAVFKKKWKCCNLSCLPSSFHCVCSRQNQRVNKSEWIKSIIQLA